MALVKVVSNNLFSGANLQKLAVGAQVEVDSSTADKGVSAGLVEMIEARTFEVATPGDTAPEQPEQPEQPVTTTKKGK